MPLRWWHLCCSDRVEDKSPPTIPLLPMSYKAILERRRRTQRCLESAEVSALLSATNWNDSVFSPPGRQEPAVVQADCTKISCPDVERASSTCPVPFDDNEVTEFAHELQIRKGSSSRPGVRNSFARTRRKEGRNDMAPKTDESEISMTSLLRRLFSHGRVCTQSKDTSLNEIAVNVTVRTSVFEDTQYHF